MYTKVLRGMLNWCDTAIPAFNRYHDEITGKKTSFPNVVRAISITKTIDDGISVIRSTQTQLSNSRIRFNILLMRIVEMELKIREKFEQEPNEYKRMNFRFYRHLETAIKELESFVGIVKNRLNHEIQEITDMKVVIKNTQGLIGLNTFETLQHVFRDQLVSLIDTSIGRCSEYKERHQ